jgi:hypothetical protein
MVARWRSGRFRRRGPGHLVTVERFPAMAEVDRAEPGEDLGWHQADERLKSLKVGEAAERTSQSNLLNDLILVPISMFRGLA